MDRATLHSRLHAWGRAFGERPARDWEEEQGKDYDMGTHKHALVRAMEIAPGTRINVARQRSSFDRAGFGRRKLMAQAAGVEGMRVVPAAFCDPVAYSETRSASTTRDRPIHPELLCIERASLDLLAADPLAGLCLRAEYCVRGPQASVLPWVEARLEAAGEPERVSLRKYREALAHAKGFVRARLLGDLAGLLPPNMRAPHNSAGPLRVH
jgi:hypothetical protein